MTIKKVASIAGVSIASVSRYINGTATVKKETAQKIELAIQSVNYHPNTLAQNFRRGKSGVIVVIVPCIGNPLYEQLTKSLSKTMKSHGYDLLIKESNHRELSLKYCGNLLRSKRADGLIVMVDLADRSSSTPNMQKQVSFERAALDTNDLDSNTLKSETFEASAPESKHKNTDAEQWKSFKKLPIIFLEAKPSKQQNWQHLTLNNHLAAETATQHLIDIGHKNITCITLNNESITQRERQNGFNSAVNKLQLSHTCHIVELDSSSSANTALLTTVLSAPPRSTAIFCTDDDIAINLLNAAKNNNIQVPTQLSIMGFNNIRYTAHTTPPLSTVQMPLNEIAEHALDQLLNMLEEKSLSAPQSKQTFQHKLIIRQSICPPA